MNSQAYVVAGVTDATPDPPGGRFDRDARGRVGGRVAEKATAAFEKVIPSDLTRDERRAGVRLIFEMNDMQFYLRRGQREAREGLRFPSNPPPTHAKAAAWPLVWPETRSSPP